MDDASVSDGRKETFDPTLHQLCAGLFGAEVEIVEGWWRGLSASERQRLSTLFDPRADSCSFRRSQKRDGSPVWRRVAIEVRGRFMADDDDREGGEDAFPVDLYEYLVNHEILLHDGAKYHVCTQHEAAESVVRVGKIPAKFVCPLDEPRCPMRRLLALAPGRSLRLVVHVEA